jgi:hypothetical protein
VISEVHAYGPIHSTESVSHMHLVSRASSTQKEETELCIFLPSKA